MKSHKQGKLLSPGNGKGGEHSKSRSPLHFLRKLGGQKEPGKATTLDSETGKTLVEDVLQDQKASMV